MRSRSAAALLAGLVGLVATGVPAASAQEQEAPPALLLVMDSSGSMNGTAGGGITKIRAAKDALNRVVDSLPDGTRVGLRVYGHRVGNAPEDKPRGCKDTELIVPVAPLQRVRMKQRIASFDARGYTPIGLSLKKAADDLSNEEGEKTIVLVSDGIDTCAPPPPCTVARRIVRRGIDLRIDSVGFQVDAQARRQLRCIARVGKGSYVDAGSAGELAENLAEISLRAIRRYETSGTPVAGGPTDAAATPIDPGQLVDSIRINEQRWYSVELAEGQELDASVTLVGRDQTATFGVGELTAGILSPAGDESDRDFELQAGGADNVTLNLSSGIVGQHLMAADPGTYSLWVRFDSERQSLSGEEFPLELIVEVTGAPVEPSPTAAPVTEPPGDPDDDRAAPPGDAGVGTDGVIRIAGSVLFLVAGAVLGAFCTRKLRGART